MTPKRMILTVVGIGLLAGSAFWMWRTWRFIQIASSAPGQVIATPNGGSHPHIRFTTATGEVIEFSQGGLIAGYEMGEPVTVLYNAEYPKNAKLHSFGAQWGFPWLGFLSGLAFVVLPNFWPKQIR